MRVRSWLWIFFTATTIEALVTVIYLLSMSADPKNSIFLGYSARRLAVIAIMLLTAMAFSAMAIKSKRNSEWAENLFNIFINNERNYHLMLSINAIAATCFWILAWSPAYLFHPYDLFFKGFLPVIVFFTVCSGQTIIVLLIGRNGINFHSLKQTWKKQHNEIVTSCLTLMLIMLVWLMIALTGMGLNPDVAFWNSVGVPIKSIQSLLAWLAGLLTILIGNRHKTHVNVIPKQQSSRRKWLLHPDLWMFIFIWLFTAILWVSEPQVKSFFAPAPRPPNDEWYPISDAAGYDTTAQFALIGEGLENGEHVDKPFYSTFLVLVHLIAGQRFDDVVAVQSILLACIPAILYLIGNLLHSRASGVVSALLGAFKGRNAIASAWMVLSANPKLLISEYLMALALILFTLFLILWLKNPEEKYLYGLAAGGVMGITTLIRHNAWILPPFALIIAWITFGRRWWRSILWNFALLGMLLVSISAWSWRTYLVTGEPWYFLGPLNGVIIDQRYTTPDTEEETLETDAVEITIPKTTAVQAPKVFAVISLNQPTSTPNPPPDDQQPSQTLVDGIYDDANSNIIYSKDWYSSPYPDHYNSTAHISCDIGSTIHMSFSGKQITLVYPTHPNRGVLQIEIDGELIDNLSQKTNRYQTQMRWSKRLADDGVHTVKLTHIEDPCVFLDAVFIGKPPPSINTRFPTGDQLLKLIRSIGESVPSHYFHNWITTALMLPTTLVNDNLQTLILAQGTVWQSDWRGSLNPSSILLFIIDLVIVALGIGFSVSRCGMAGAVPLIVYIAYTLGVALARTSGGRYIVPVDWVFPLYFAIGLVQLTLWLLTLFGYLENGTESGNIIRNNHRFQPYWVWKCLLVIAGFLLLGAAPLASEHIIPKRYPDRSKLEAYQLLVERGDIYKMGFDTQEVEKFLQDKNSVFRIGRALYPRFFHPNTGEPAKGAYRYMDFQRLVVTVISPDGVFNGVLPIGAFPNIIPHAADIAIIGCDNSDASLLALVVFGDEDIVYSRTPKAALTCPIPDPICDGNGNCR